jgi:hypothetical protein
MGEKMAEKFCRKWRLPRHFWVLLHAVKHDMGQTALIPLRRKVCWRFFHPKNPTISAGFEPANLGTKDQHATSRPPKQPDALITQILFCYKTLHVSGNLFAHHQEFSTVHSALVSFMQVFFIWWPFPSRVRLELQFHPDSAWKRSLKTRTKLTSAEYTVENSWWWAKRLPETCRDFTQLLLQQNAHFYY